MYIGAHVSVARGYIAALDYAQSVGAECMQVFAKSPRQWHAPAIDRTAAETFVEERRTRGFGRVFTHTAYLINWEPTTSISSRGRSLHLPTRS